MSTTRSRTTRAARRSASVIALVSLAVAGTCGTSSAVPTSAGSVAASASSLPSDCHASYQEASERGVLSEVTRVPQGVDRRQVYDTVDYGDGPEQPRAMAEVDTARGPILVSVRRDGTLWSHQAFTIVKPLQVGTGWGAIRQMAGLENGSLYALTTYGGLVRYDVRLSTAGNAVVRSAGVVGGRGWNGIAFLAPVETTRQAAVFMGVSTSTGELMEYWIRTTDNTARGYALRPSWGGMKHVSVGGCRTSGARTILGLHENGNVYAYVDRVNDFSGRDIEGFGILAEDAAPSTSLYSG